MRESADRRGWTRVAFGDVVRHVRDRVDPEESGLDRYVAGEHMDTDDLRIRRWGTTGNGYLGPAFHMRFRPGHVLYGSRRTYLRKVAVADFEGITANTTFVIETKDPNILLPDLLPFIMQTESFHAHSIGQSKGSVNPYVNFSDLTWYEFDLPPLEEQRKISQLLGACESTFRATFQLETQLQEVEAAVVDEFLLWQDRRGACSIPLGQLCASRPSYGVNAPATRFRAHLPRYIRITDIDDDGKLAVEDPVSVVVQDPDSYRVRRGDLLFARTGNTVGKVYLASGDEGNAVYAGYLIRFTPDTRLVAPKYLFALTRSHRYKNWVRQKSRVGAQPNINAGEYGSLPILLPRQLADQEALVRTFDEIRASKACLTARLAELARTKRALVDSLVLREEG